MSDLLLDAVARRVDAADAVWQTDHTLTLQLDQTGVQRVEERSSQRTQLRVLRHGRLGVVGSESPDDLSLAEMAMARVREGPTVELLLPVPAPTHPVETSSPKALHAGVHDLVMVARALYARLESTALQLQVWVERSIGEVRVANTRGVTAQYDVSLVGIGARVVPTDGEVPCCVHVAQCRFPDTADFEDIVDEVGRRLQGSRRVGSVLPPTLPVIFAPDAVATLLHPIRSAAIPLQSDPQEMHPIEVDSTLGLWDDPWAPGRPGSRPIDDDGVVTRPVPLVEEGRLVGYIADVELGSRTNRPSTGHGSRGGTDLSTPRFSNLRMLPGRESLPSLLQEVGNGLLVHTLDPLGGNLRDGRMHARALWCHRIHNGEIAERIEGVVLAGSVFDMLRRVIGLSRTVRWVGSCELPYLAIDRVSVRCLQS